MPDLAFTLSSSFSGSTLLSFLLNAHPEVTSLSEFDPLGNISRNPNFMCSCGRPIRACPFYREVTQKLHERGVDFSVENMDMMLRLNSHERVNDLLTGRIPVLQSSALEDVRDRLVGLVPGYRRAMRRTTARNDAFVDAVLEITGARVYVDANKDAYRMRFFNRTQDVKAIYLFKNGIGGAHSFMRHARSGQKQDIAAASHRWFKEQITINRSLEYLTPERVVNVPYSELCGDVRGTLRRIYRVLGVADVDTPHPNEVEHHVVGNEMRLGRIDAIEEREYWKTELSAAQVDTYRRVYDKYAARLERMNPVLAAAIWH